MLDNKLRPFLDRPIGLIVQKLNKNSINANSVTCLSLCIGLLTIPALTLNYFNLALLLILLNRIGDGLDGALARLHPPSDFGGYLDTVCDFIFYGAVVLGFALANPEQNALPATFLLFSFFGTGASFHAWAIYAHAYPCYQKHTKGFAYLHGLTEGTETIVLFIGICLFPDHFPTLAYLFSGACWITTTTRIIYAYRVMRVPNRVAY